MTSKSLFWAEWKENIKRRSWTFVLCAAALFILMPVRTMLTINNDYNRIQDMISAGGGAEYIEKWHQMMRIDFYSCVQFDPVYVLAGAFFAILFSVQGFSFLYDKRKMDLYMSVPVSGVKRYALVCGNAVFMFGICYLPNLVLCWGVGIFFGILNMQVIACSLLAFVMNMLAFAALTQLSLLAVMLTGNTLTALLGSIVLFVYEGVIRILYQGYKTWFFVSYCNKDNLRLSSKAYFTPFFGYFQFSGRARFTADSAFPTFLGQNGWLGMGKEALMLLLAAAVFGGLSYLLFRKRKTESYSMAIAFPAIKGVIEILLLIPFSMAVGLLFARLGENRSGFIFAGAFGGLLIGHAVIQLIYEKDIRAIGGQKGLAAFCLAATGVILCIFRYDLFGFDAYLPKADEIESISVSMETDYSNFGRYKLEGEEYADFAADDLIDHMDSRDPETIGAVLAMVSDWQQAGMPQDSGYIPEKVARGEAWDEAAQGQENYVQVQRFVVRYRLKDGKDVYRRFLASGDLNPDEMDALMRDESYRKIRYQIYSDAFLENLGKMKISYNDGRQDLLYTGEKEEILDALRKDFESYSYELLAQKLPCGILKFSMPGEYDYAQGKYEWNYPVYDSFVNTIAVLEKNGIWEADKNSILTAEDVEKITVSYYVQEGDESDPVFAENEVEPQQIVCTFEDPDQIREMLQAMYSAELVRVADEEVRAVERDYRVMIRNVALTPQAQNKRYPVEEYALFFRKGQTPGFVTKAIREAAVYN